MDIVGKIKDLYISPEFVTEKTMNGNLFTITNCQGGGENCPYSANVEADKNSCGSAPSYDEGNISVNSQENKYADVKSEDAPPKYSQNGEQAKEANEAVHSPSKEYAAWEQYKKYLDKHNRYVVLAKKGD